MTEVKIQAVDGVFAVWFDYDPEVVALIKTLPPAERSWDPADKRWLVDGFQLGPLIAVLKAYGHQPVQLPPEDPEVTRQRRHRRSAQAEEDARRARQQQEDWEASQARWRENWEQARRDQERRERTRRQSPRGGPASADWADTLLRAVGPDRHEAVFKALTRVLHPDAATGDEDLMKDLNQARDRLR